MSKKLLILITSIILLLVVLGGGLFIYLYTKNTTPEGVKPSVVETIKKLNPFGDSNDLDLGDIVKNVLPNSLTGNSNASENSQQPEALLFKLSNERVSGIDFADVLVPKLIEVRRKILIDNPLAASSSKNKKISVTATSSETVFSTSTRIRFVEQGSGHIYEYDYASSTSRKLTNTTIPKTQEAYFLDRGSKVLLRYLDSSNKNVENYLATIPVSGVTSALTGNFLSNNLSDIAVSQSTFEFAYVAKTSSGSILNIYNTRTGSERRISNSNFSEWLPYWRQNNIFMQTKAHSSFAGSVYSQSFLGSRFERVLGNINGLTVLPNISGNKILIGNGVNLSITDIKTRGNTTLQDLYTIPEKCIWLSDSSLVCFGQDYVPEGAFPEAWYQGRFLFQDAIFSINVNTGEVYRLATMSEIYNSEVFIDAFNIKYSADGFLVFTNKIDMTPWYLNIGKLLSNF